MIALIVIFECVVHSDWGYDRDKSMSHITVSLISFVCPCSGSSRHTLSLQPRLTYHPTSCVVVVNTVTRAQPPLSFSSQERLVSYLGHRHEEWPVHWRGIHCSW